MVPHASPLDAAHRALGAKMGAFGGWKMPISYAGTLAEHASVRERVGLFDVSHLGKVIVRGAGTRVALDRVFTNRMDDLRVGRSRYTLLCDERGGIIDDLICYALAEDVVLVVPNASNRDLVADAIRAHAGHDLSVEVWDAVTLAVQGPRSKALVEERFPIAKGLPALGVASDTDVTIARTGYTGEWGYELFGPTTGGATLWDEVLGLVRAAGGEPCGLAARDTLRLEMGYPLYGNDLSTEVTPFEAGLGWAVKLEGREFPGAAALRAHTPTRRLRGLRALDRSIPRAHCVVLRDGEPIGEVTSGTFSPTAKVGIALAYLPVDTIGEVEVDVRGKRGRFRVVDPPFVDADPKREPVLRSGVTN